MSEQSSNRSVRAIAAAGLAACSLTAVTDQAQAAPVWQPGASDAIGTYTTISGVNSYFFEDMHQQAVDFDQDGLAEFFIYYYGGWVIDGVRSWSSGFPHDPVQDGIYDPISVDLNPSAEVVLDLATAGGPGFIDPLRATNLSDIYQQAGDYLAVPEGDRPQPYLATNWLKEVGFTQRSLWSGTFIGGTGKQYVGYLDLEVVPDSSTDQYSLVGDGSITIYDAGFAQIPEPSSLALLAAGGLLLARRRRRA